MTEKLVWIDAITQRPAMRWRTSRSARRSESDSKRSASAVVRPIVLPSMIPLTESDSCTWLERSASVSCVVFAIRRRSLPTRRVSTAKIGMSANANSASSQLSRSMPTIVATTVVRLEVMFVAVFVTTFCTPPMSFEMRDCTSPVRVRVKNASDSRWRWRNTRGAQVVHDALADLVRHERLHDVQHARRDRERDHPARAPGDRRRVVAVDRRSGRAGAGTPG